MVQKTEQSFNFLERVYTFDNDEVKMALLRYALDQHEYRDIISTNPTLYTRVIDGKIELKIESKRPF